MFAKVDKILVPVNGHSANEAAFRLACELSQDNKSKLFALYVIEVEQELPVDAELADKTALGETVLERIEMVSQEMKRPVEADIVQARHAGPAIVQEAMDKQVGLLVLGIPFKSHLGAFALGQATSYILKNTPCPVILWREPVAAAPATMA